MTDTPPPSTPRNAGDELCTTTGFAVATCACASCSMTRLARGIEKHASDIGKNILESFLLCSTCGRRIDLKTAAGDRLPLSTAIRLGWRAEGDKVFCPLHNPQRAP